MKLDSGTLTAWRGVNETPPGGMPDMEYSKIWGSYYGDKTVGVTRFYTAKQYGDTVDMVVQVQRTYDLKAASDLIVLSPFSHKEDKAYRITQIQQVIDDDGNPRTDLALERTEINADYIY